MTIITYLLFVGLIGVWANNLNRNVFGYVIFAFLLSPLVAGITLAIVGRKVKRHV